MTPEQLTNSLKSAAHQLGFQIAGACPAIEPTGYQHFSNWLEDEYAGEMTYLSDRKSAYEHPRNVLDGVVSLLMLGMNYQTESANPTKSGQGRIARYAWGKNDYHDLIHERLKQLRKTTLELRPDSNVRGVVDTAPLLEREFAKLSGLGWQAKNTMLISKQQGSWFFLAALLVDFQLKYDQPFEASHCGTCTACLDACPTNAFPSPGVLNATKCISYLTIEHRTQIPVEMRSGIGDWLLGCDICQEVCPWNRKAEFSDEPTFDPLTDQNPINLRELFTYDDNQFRKRFRKTPLWRPKRRGILRNAAIVLGNSPDPDNLPALQHGLNDVEPLIRGASAWALGQHAGSDSIEILQARFGDESDDDVRQEIESALRQLNS